MFKKLNDITGGLLVAVILLIIVGAMSASSKLDAIGTSVQVLSTRTTTLEAKFDDVVEKIGGLATKRELDQQTEAMRREIQIRHSLSAND